MLKKTIPDHRLPQLANCGTVPCLDFGNVFKTIMKNEYAAHHLFAVKHGTKGAKRLNPQKSIFVPQTL